MIAALLGLAAVLALVGLWLNSRVHQPDWPVVPPEARIVPPEAGSVPREPPIVTFNQHRVTEIGGEPWPPGGA